jgi:hypothetical protein
MSGYLRRYRLEPRRDHGRLLAGALVVIALLFAKVWQSTAASSLSMERDRLRREVRVLENRIRLSSELRVQAALREGLDHRALAARGFQNPDPSAVILIDLSKPLTHTVREKDGVVARLGSLWRGLGGRKGLRDDEARAVPVSARPDTGPATATGDPAPVVEETR